MKQFLLYLTKISGYKMRNFLIPVLFSIISNFAIAQTSGIYESYAILSINGGSDTYYDMQASTGNPDLNGANLGSFVYGLNTLVVKGGENKTFKNLGCNINSSAILFRVYLTGSPSGSYINIAESWVSNDVVVDGNQIWRATTGATNLIAGLLPGSYTLEVYSQAGYDGCGTGTHFSSNGGANYKAAFTVVKAESTIAVTGTTSFTYNNTPQGPSTASVTGSTGAVTYSYVGVSPTIYAANATPPTNPGTYTVTATLASDDNYNGASSTATSFTIGAGLYTYIPDANFLQALITAPYNITASGDCVLTSEISNVESLNLSGKNIASLVGINDFIKLKFLNCANNALTSLNISGLTNLWELVTNNNQISSLDVSLSPYLYFLDCEKNQINSLNISGLTRLETLIVLDNQLTSIDASNNPDLTYLDCDNNAFTSINVTGLSNLEYFYCSNNKLQSINVSGLSNLIDFYCNDNLLTSIDVTGLTNLEYYYCNNNKLSSINVAGLTKLIDFYCNDNLLTSIDVTGLTNLDYFDCSVNPLSCIIVDDVAAANTANAKEILPSTDPKSYYWTKDALDIYSFCNCLLTTTWDGTSWSPVAPTDGTYAAIIAGNYSQPANISACSLTIKNGATVTIPSGTNVTLNAPLTVETGGVFTLSNNANLIQSTNTANIGNVEVNRNSNSLYRSDYTMWSSPVASQNLLAFSPLTTVIASPPSSRFYIYDSATNFYTTIANPSATAFAKGAGYLIRMPNEDPSNLGGGTLYSLGTATLTYNGVFTGVPNNGDVPVTLNYVDAAHGYNMVGNPYPSTIDANKFIADNAAKIESTLYFWRKTNAASGSAYASYTAGGGTTVTPTSEIPNGTIQVGQGFFVQAKSVGPIANFFTNAMRLGTSSTQFFKTKQVAEKDRVWLNLTNATGVFSQALVAYITDATQGVDMYDGKYINDSPIALTSNINNEEYTIQGRPTFDASDVVALNFKTNLAGDYTIAIDHVDGLFSGSQEVFLKDNNTGIETDLKVGAYTFAAAAGVDNARFSLKYQKTLGVSNLVFNEDSVTVHKNKGTLYVNSGAMTINNIKVFDIQGRLIAEQKNVKSNSATIKDLKATQQVLIVKITSQDNKVVSKKVVN